MWMNFSWPILGLFIFMRSTLIGSEDLPKIHLEMAPSTLERPQKSISDSPSPKTLSRPEFALKSKTEMDIELFLKEFRRQAEETGLFECLNLNIPSPYSALFQAVITNAGELSSLQVIGIKEPLPDCARKSISAMNFSEVAKGMPTERHKMIWRVDW